MRLKILVLVACLAMASANPIQANEIDSKSEEFTDEAFIGLIKLFLEEKGLNLTVVFNQGQYYNEGKLKQIDSAGFVTNVPSKNENNDPLDIGDLTREDIDAFLNLGNQLGLLGILSQETYNEDGFLETLRIVTPDIEVVYENGLSSVLAKNAERTDFDDLEAEIKNFQNEGWYTAVNFNEDGEISTNATIILTPDIVEIIEVDKNFPASWVLDASDALRKACRKVKTHLQRCQYLVTQMDKKFPKYKWEVVVNSVFYYVNKDIYVKIKLDGDVYVLYGRHAIPK